MKVAAIVLSFLCALPLAADRFDMRELVGHWADDKWAAALETSRSPIAAANVEAPLAFSIEPAKNGSYRFPITDFHESTWRVAYDIQQSNGGSLIVVGPLEDANAMAKKERIALSAERDASGHVIYVTAAFWSHDTPAVRFRRLDEPVKTWARRTVLMGEYTEGVSPSRWNFSVDGSLSRPEHGIEKYELNLDPSEACCDWLTISEKRIGFAWHDGVLRLYSIVENPEDCPISCAKESFVTLVPRKTRPWNGTGAAATLQAPQRLVKVDVVAEAGTKDKWFVARGSGVEVRFNNPDGQMNPIGFNEPPFLIRAAGHTQSCKALDTNAARDGVWISADGRYVGFETWSGSSTGLDLFDAATCRRTARIDASGGLAIAGTIVTTDPSCEPESATTAYCFPAAIYRLGASGTLEALEAAGRERTKTMLGVSIDRAAHVEWPYTSKARIAP